MYGTVPLSIEANLGDPLAELSVILSTGVCAAPHTLCRAHGNLTHSHHPHSCPRSAQPLYLSLSCFPIQALQPVSEPGASSGSPRLSQTSLSCSLQAQPQRGQRVGFAKEEVTQAREGGDH